MLQVLPGTDRAAVERADEALRSFQGGVITDPTVFVKSAALGAQKTSGLGRVSLALSAGNFAAIGYKPA